MTAPSLRSPSRRARLLAACAGLAVGAVVLTGCTGSPGAAAVVGDTTISEQQLADDVAELTADPNAGIEDANSSTVTSLLGRLITMKLVDQLAAQHDVTITEGQIANEIAAYEQQVGSKDAVYQTFAQQGVPASQVEGMVRTSLQVTALGPILKPDGTSDEQTQAIIDEIVKLGDDDGVQVNPRWGTWDAASLNLGPTPDDLSSLPS